MANSWFIIALFLCATIQNNDSLPTNNETDIIISDAWNYETKPHDMPLFNFSDTVHELPPDPQVHNIQILVKRKKKPKKMNKLGNSVNSIVDCRWCDLGVSLLIDEIKMGSSFEKIRKKVVDMCFDFNLSTREVCEGIFDVFGPTIIAAAKKSPLNAKQACSLLLGEGCKGKIKNPLQQWKVSFPNVTKPPLKTIASPKPGVPTYKILHLSDTHLDPSYMEGSVSNCLEPLCCRNESTEGVSETIPAGKWGAYAKCDSPKILVENMLKHITEEHPDIDFIIWTGDLPPHDVWKQDKSYNLEIIRETTRQMIEYFPATPIFPAVGNHESVPPGSFAPPWVDEKHSISWLYNELASHWKRWLPVSATNTVKHGGFYSVLLRPKLRLISVNTNYCYILNWWLLVNSTDPAKELKWLIHELQEAENRDEKVLLIGHIPPGGSDCMKVWSENFYNIISRYEGTVTAQFYGHTHSDEFEMFYDPDDLSRPINVAYLGPSVTTFENFNPAYRVYYITGEHFQTPGVVVDHETWTMDLEKANNVGEPEWYRLYSARKDLDIESLLPQDWNNYLNKLIDVPDAFHQFYKYYYRNSPTRPKCDEKCKLRILCDLRCGKSHNRHVLCRDLEEKFSG